jgi:hypothetical protein
MPVRNRNNSVPKPKKIRPVLVQDKVKKNTYKFVDSSKVLQSEGPPAQIRSVFRQYQENCYRS